MHRRFARFPRRHTTSMVVIASLLTVAPATLHAQLVRGVVRDVTTTIPLETVSLTLLMLSDSALGTAASDDAGEFSLRAPAAGTYRIRLRRIGYKEAVSDPIHLRIAETVTVDLALAPAASPLPPVRITERSRLTRGRDLMAFRESLGRGVFLRQTEIQELGGARLSDVLAKVEGIRVNQTRGVLGTRETTQQGHRVGEHEMLTSTRGYGCLHVVLNGGDLQVFERVLFNEDPLRRIPSQERPIWLNDLLAPAAVAGIEIYRDFGEVPPDLRYHAWPPDNSPMLKATGSSVPCGVVFIWTHAAW